MANENFNGNIIQFPGRRKEAEGESKPATPEAKAPAPKAKKPRRSKKNVGATVLAIILATAAVNTYVFGRPDGAESASSGGRGLASVERLNFTRDAAWEKDLAEKLASPQIRALASTAIGRPASIEDKLRWGTLEEKYTIAYSEEDHRIRSILLQDDSTAPSYVLDREQFLREYGSLFEADFKVAKLKSVETSNGKTVESYTLIKGDDQPGVEARFELDRHKRLLSLKVESSEI